MSAPLNQMIQVLRLQMGLYDDTSATLMRQALNIAYNEIWDKYPWGDATGYGYADVIAGQPFVDYPVGMDRIITLTASAGASGTPPGVPEEPEDPFVPPPVSWDTRLIDPVEIPFLMESEPTIFDDHGYVKYYADTGTASNRQIRLLPTTTWGLRLTFYGKMICPGLLEDTDTSVIRNIDTALIAYAYSAMLQRQRQYGKADIKRKEALELEANAWNLEQQQANQPRRTKATTVAGNSLAEMTDAVCMICGQWTPEYRLIIREFLRRNYQALYDMFLWPESLVAVYVPYTTEQVILPHYVDKVIGVQGMSGDRMFPADAGLILDINPRTFQEIGHPVSYTTLAPVAVSTLPSVTTRLVLASTSPVDRTKVLIRGDVIQTGQELVEEVILNGTTPVLTTFSYDIPLTIAKDVTYGGVTVNAASDYRLLVQLPRFIRELKHQRLWFLPKPDSGNLPTLGFFQCLVLAKRVIYPLLSDQDTPIITGAQQVLIAAAAGDVFRKLEKADQATAMLQKASASTEVLKAKNTDQAASAPRFVPQVEAHSYVAGCGYGW